MLIASEAKMKRGAEKWAGTPSQLAEGPAWRLTLSDVSQRGLFFSWLKEN